VVLAFVLAGTLHLRRSSDGLVNELKPDGPMGNLFALPNIAANADYLEDTSPLRLVLEFYDREHAPLVRYLCFLNVNPETAKEIVQDCFIKLHEHLDSNGDTTNLRAWLYRVAHNLARNSQLSARARKTESLTDVTPQKEAVSSELSAEDRLLEAERMRLLREGITRLPEAQKQALVLRSQGLKYREIAQTLGLSTSTVAENIQRGMDALKKIVA
jgi:RNA polymerase sigma-70 factor (ECF subfamily)